MSLTPGARLGGYEIVASIGEGGMGHVYRARDPQLARDVAIKVLPEAFADDVDRLARFQREARTLAALNHPHIAAIYGLVESDGASALVMELVEGENLSQRLVGGAIPIEEALPIAKQIAEALEAAHEQGIVHRDLKPANVMVRPDGTVKVLDFGLAKALDPADGNREAPGVLSPHSPTITSPAITMRGVILGTAAYMSPEQAAGKPLDKRSDIWAFGVVLLEMLTGRQVFTGETVSHVLASVLKTEPDWALLPADTPPTIRRLLRRCLEKDRKRRLADAADARLEVEEALTTSASVESPALAPSSRPLMRLLTAALAIAVTVIAAMTVPMVRHLRESPPPPAPVTRTEIVTPATNNLVSFALSPDGGQVVFTASGDGVSRLWLRSLATTTAQPLAGTEGAAYPFWSPDSRSLGFFAGGTLKRLDLGGGAPRALAPAIAGRGGTWTADGVILVAPGTTGPLMRVSATGGEMVAVTTLGERQTNHRWPLVLPDGQHFLFYAFGAPAAAGIYLGALDGSAPTRLTPADSAGVFLSEALDSGAASGRGEPGRAGASGEGGWLLWVRAGTLLAQRLDVARRVLVGEPMTVADGVAASTTLLSGVSVAVKGLVAYRHGGGNQRQLTWVDRSGTTLGMLGASDGEDLDYPSVSPDGRRVAVTRRVQGNTDLWLMDGTRMTRFTFDAGVDQSPVWWPDGSRIAFNSNRTGQFDLYQKPASGTAVEERLVASNQFKSATGVSADGRFLIYHSIDPQTLEDLWVVPVSGDRTPLVFLKTPFRELSGVFSPDGRWVAYMADEGDQMQIYVRPFTAPPASGAGANEATGQWQISTTGGTYPKWRSDGRELFYLSPAGDLMAATITAKGATLEAGAPVTRLPRRVFGGRGDPPPGPLYDVARDGRFLINAVVAEVTPPITLLMNWRPEGSR